MSRPKKRAFRLIFQLLVFVFLFAGALELVGIMSEKSRPSTVLTFGVIIIGLLLGAFFLWMNCDLQGPVSGGSLDSEDMLPDAGGESPPAFKAVARRNEPDA